MSAIKLANPDQPRLSEGRQWIALKHIEAPNETQPRDGVNKEWCDDLWKFKLEGSQWPPVKVFQLPDGRLVLAEGHHRRWAALNGGDADILCEVANGTMEDAIVYAAGSNRSNGVKPMSSKDVTKAIRMLFSFNEWWETSDVRVAEHVSCSSAKVRIVRATVATECNRAMPEYTVTHDGKARRRTRVSGNGTPAIYPSTKGDGRIRWEACFLGKKVTSRNKAVLEEKLKRLIEENQVRLSHSGIVSTLQVRGFSSIFGKASSPMGVSAFRLNDIVCVVSEGKSPKDICLACGQIIAAQSYCGRDRTRAIVIAYIRDNELTSLFRTAGIEFMTPDEFIASLGPVIPDELKPAK